MTTRENRPKAKRARQVFAGSQSLNGSDPPGNGQGRCVRPAVSTLPRVQQQFYNPDDRKQVRSGPIIKIIRYAHPPFVQVLQATVRDNRLSFGARGFLAYLLSLPKDWQPLMWWIRQETALGVKKLRRYMNELREYGYAHLKQERSADGRQAIGTYWLVCEFPNPAWLKEGNSLRVPKGDCQISAPHKNDPRSKNDPLGPTDRGSPEATMAVFDDVPRLPFPKSEEAMYLTLEDYSDVLDRYGVDADPDHDGSFFNDFVSRGWHYPSGRRVRNWMVAYIQRRLHIEEGMGR